MSGFISEPLRSDEQRLVISEHEASEASHTRRHDRIPGRRDLGDSVTMGSGDEPEVEVEINAGQKMLSAVSGSLLTSLLGIVIHDNFQTYRKLTNPLSVTPLDVVRVRLQSQAPQLRSYTLPSLGPPSTFTNLPPNIGVTACCREVFWVNNTSPFCIAASPTSTLAAINPPPSASDCAVDETRRKTFTSTLDGLRKIARHEGPSSLWRGLSPTLVMAIPANVIYFTGYDSLRFNPHSPIHRHIPDAYAPLIAGSIARVAAASVISPIEMFRTRMQAATSGSGTGVFAETLVGLRKMVKAQGYTSLWRGLTLTMWRDVPFSGIYWWGYEAVRNSLTEMRETAHLRSGGRPRSNSRTENHTSTFVDSFIAGAASGAVASVVTTPFDVGKTRQQVLEQRSKIKAPLSKSALRPEELPMPRFLLHIWKEEGMPGLFRGWAARCLKVAPACAIMISSYEVGKKMARRMNERKIAGLE